MAADRWIALAFLVFCIVYGVAAWNYPILPFERHNPFKPNTLPLGLAVAGAILAFVTLVTRRPEQEAGDDEGAGLTLARLHLYDWPHALGLVVAMVVYALTLRPLGFIAATILFLGGGAVILGERRLHVLVPVVTVGTVAIWYLVDQVLGIFLRPWPWFVAL